MTYDAYTQAIVPVDTGLQAAWGVQGVRSSRLITTFGPSGTAIEGHEHI